MIEYNYTNESLFIILSLKSLFIKFTPWCSGSSDAPTTLDGKSKCNPRISLPLSSCRPACNLSQQPYGLSSWTPSHKTQKRQRRPATSIESDPSATGPFRRTYSPSAASSAPIQRCRISLSECRLRHAKARPFKAPTHTQADTISCRTISRN